MTCSANSFLIALTRPKLCPAKTISPALKVPCWTSNVATTPRPGSIRDSTTTPRAAVSFTAVNSCISACNETASSNWSIPSPVNADTWMNCVSPPQSSGITSFADNSFFTRSGSADSLSHLLIATTIGTPAAFACLTASSVCGITPSSAATTRITTSVHCAPRARIEVNAAWPGVSRKVISPWLVWTR